MQYSQAPTAVLRGISCSTHSCLMQYSKLSGAAFDVLKKSVPASEALVCHC